MDNLTLKYLLIHSKKKKKIHGWTIHQLLEIISSESDPSVCTVSSSNPGKQDENKMSLMEPEDRMTDLFHPRWAWFVIIVQNPDSSHMKVLYLEP